MLTVVPTTQVPPTVILAVGIAECDEESLCSACLGGIQFDGIIVRAGSGITEIYSTLHSRTALSQDTGGNIP